MWATDSKRIHSRHRCEQRHFKPLTGSAPNHSLSREGTAATVWVLSWFHLGFACASRLGRAVSSKSWSNISDIRKPRLWCCELLHFLNADVLTYFFATFGVLSLFPDLVFGYFSGTPRNPRLSTFSVILTYFSGTSPNRRFSIFFLFWGFSKISWV